MNRIFIKLIAVAMFFAAFSCSTSRTLSLKWATMNVRYDNPADSLNNWNYRKDSVAAFIKRQNIDVIGLQEVRNNQLEDLKLRLPEYAEVGVGRDDGKTAGEYAPIFYKKDKFDLLDSKTFWLSQYPDSAGFVGWDGACTRIATWAKLKNRENGQVVFAINTHLDHVGVDARKKGALLIIEQIKKLAEGMPVVLTGDFNVPETSEVYSIITNNEFKFNDAQKVAETTSGPKYTFHNFGKSPLKKREKIDYIFVTPEVTVKNSSIEQETAEDNFFLSDHNPQVVTLEIR